MRRIVRRSGALRRRGGNLRQGRASLRVISSPHRLRTARRRRHHLSTRAPHQPRLRPRRAPRLAQRRPPAAHRRRRGARPRVAAALSRRRLPRGLLLARARARRPLPAVDGRAPPHDGARRTAEARRFAPAGLRLLRRSPSPPPPLLRLPQLRLPLGRRRLQLLHAAALPHRRAQDPLLLDQQRQAPPARPAAHLGDQPRAALLRALPLLDAARQRGLLRARARAARAPPRLMKVAVVVVNYDRRELLRECLRSLAEGGDAPLVVVVDNGSTDGSAEGASPGAAVLVLPHNTGLSHAYNVGIRHALTLDAEGVLVLNNDTRVAPGALAALAAATESAAAPARDGDLASEADDDEPRPRIGMVAARVVLGAGGTLGNQGLAGQVLEGQVLGGSGQR